MRLLNTIGVALLWSALITTSATAEILRHNPFRVPLDLAPSSGSAAGAATASRPTLIGILLGDDQPLVNLGGDIIGVGEETSGYRLVEVGQEYAVFRRGEETITMSLYPGEDNE